MDEPASKKKKYFSKFADEWLRKEAYKDWLGKIDIYTAKCKLCNVQFTVKHDGDRAVKTHLNSDCHVKLTKSTRSNQLMTAFMTVKGK